MPLRKAIGWSVAFVAVGLLVMLPLVWAGTWLVHGGIPQPGQPGPGVAELALVQGVAGTAGVLLATWLVGLRWAGLTPAELRWHGGPTPPVRGFVGGAALGLLAAGLALALAVPLGGARWVPDGGGVLEWLMALGLTTGVLLPAAAFEEFAFRGVPLVLVAAAIGRVPAALVLATLFALGHAANPSATPLGLLNIGVAGLFLTAAFYAPGGIWTAIGAHLGWNTTLAALDAPVSGLPFAMPLLDYLPGGPRWLTGGSFGPEGGLLATAALGLGVAAAIRWMRKDALTA